MFSPDWMQLNLLPTRAHGGMISGSIALGAGIVVAVATTAAFALIGAVQLGATFGMGIGLVVAVATYEREIAPTDQLHWSWTKLRGDLPRVFVLVLGLSVAAGLTIGLINALAAGLSDVSRNGTAPVVAYRVAVPDAFGWMALSVGLSAAFGSIMGLAMGMFGALEARQLVTPPKPGFASGGQAETRWPP